MANPALAASFGLDIDFDSFNSAVNAVNKLDKGMSKFFDGAQKIAGVFAAGGVLKGVVSFAEGAVNAYAETEKAITEFEHALSNLGITNKETQKGLEDYAGSLARASMASRSEILDTERLLTTFGMSGETLKKSTKAALDLSAGLGVDLRTATMLLGKAFDGNTASLAKLGIRIDENIPRAEVFAEVMRIVNERFGSSASAEMETYAGQLNLMHKDFGAIYKDLGQDLMPVAKWWLGWLKDLHTILEEVMPSLNLASPVKNLERELENLNSYVEKYKDKNFIERFFAGGASIESAKKRIAEIKAQLSKLEGRESGGSTKPTRQGGLKEKPDTSELKAALSDTLQAIKANLDLRLTATKQNYDAQIIAVKEAGAQEISAIKKAEGQKVITSSKAKADILKVEADTAKAVAKLEEEKAAAAKKSAEEREKIDKAVAELRAKLETDEGRAMVAYLGAEKVAKKMTALEGVKDSQDAANQEKMIWTDLQNAYKAGSKTVAGAWKQALIEMSLESNNWKGTFQSFIGTISSSFGSAVNSMIFESQNLGQALKAIGLNVAQTIISTIVEMGVKYALVHTLMKASSVSTAGVQTAAETAATVASITGAKTAAMAQIQAAAAAGAAWAEAASMMTVVGIPLAPAAGLAAYAEIMKNSALLAFAKGGYTGDGARNAITGFVHGGEYVLPAAVTSSYGLRGKSVDSAMNILTGSNGGNVVNSPVNITIAGGISSELDVNKVCKQIADKVRYNVKEAVYLANVMAKQGAKVAGRTI